MANDAGRPIGSTEQATHSDRRPSAMLWLGTNGPLGPGTNGPEPRGSLFVVALIRASPRIETRFRRDSPYDVGWPSSTPQSRLDLRSPGLRQKARTGHWDSIRRHSVAEARNWGSMVPSSGR